MKNLINKIKSSFSRKSAFEKKFGIPLDHFLEETPDGGLAFAQAEFLKFIQENGGDHRDLMDAMAFIHSKQS